MAKKKDAEPQDPLGKLLHKADAKTLAELIQNLAATRPEVRRECLEFLQKRVPLSPEVQADAEAGIAFALWDELEPDLSELNEYGGGPEESEGRVSDLLHQLATTLQESHVPREDRQAIRSEVLSYIQSRNSGMEDLLYEVAYATCQDDEDLRDFAASLEALGQDWPLSHAQGIYRRLQDRDKYLALRGRRLEFGGDYHDLATFYCEQGEKDKALAIAREGLQKGKGRMDELRAFLAERARESGDRGAYLELQLAQATAPLTLASYQAFQKVCSEAEWKVYEPRVLAVLEQLRGVERLQILLERGEEDQAVRLLSGLRYPDQPYVGDALLQIAARLEEKYPEQVLAFYLTGLPKGKQNTTRAGYAREAQVARKVRRVWVDVLQQPEKWEAFARPLKLANKNRPAFQEEFTRAVPGWKTL